MVTEYAALIEPIENQFRARTSAPFDATAFGLTETEALERLDAEVRARLMQGAKVVRRSVSTEAAHPLARFAGDLKNDALADDWQASMEAYRQEVESDPNYL